MSIFITYARQDKAIVTTVREDIVRMHHEVWIDEMLRGGEQWWNVILAEIRKCDIYVFALSESSLRSKPCKAELQYAEQLGKPIVPLMVGTVDPSLAPPVIANAQVLDLRARTADSILVLRDALDAQPPAPALPEPLPAPPPVPVSYLNALADEVDAGELTFSQQVALVAQLKARLAGDDQSRGTAADLLRRLRRRGDLSQQVVADIDATLRAFDQTAPSANPWGPPDEALIVTPPRRARSRRGLLVAGVVAALGVLGGTAVLAVRAGGSEASGPIVTTSTAPPRSTTTSAPAATTTTRPATTTSKPITTDDVQHALITEAVGASDQGPASVSTYPCNNRLVFSGMNAYLGRLLVFNDAALATAAVAFTTSADAESFVEGLPTAGCDAFQHSDGDIETTMFLSDSTYHGANLRSYLWIQTGNSNLVGYDTYIQAGRAVGFITCFSSVDADPRTLVQACDDYVQQFASNLIGLSV